MSRPQVRQMNSPRSGNPVPNQFIIRTSEGTYFQSYGTLIGFKPIGEDYIVLDKDYWNYSRTTSKYRHIWMLGHGVHFTSDELNKIADGKEQSDKVRFEDLQ